ncbi:hypothetical protein BU25DRAFT_415694 [Macroventuria anomochaeta]|uniref:Uncharacterized protein n=1 Tax=Macroventuria anomochaeta TaxID=301207 RepID=A0ACB6RJ52_9PLEO|nr:uncharacterized protein BU25DRAFT_415694 [Macroventuria anomochaeta]KAF2621843.1 hypothetical protein BU25DRAFT_415694 [Macroventuria anomochaeta]
MLATEPDFILHERYITSPSMKQPHGLQSRVAPYRSWELSNRVTSLPAVRTSRRAEQNHRYFDLERVLLPPHSKNYCPLNVITCCQQFFTRGRLYGWKMQPR